MPIPFQDSEGASDLGAAAFLRIESLENASVFRAALFLINVRGEPMEFTYNRIETPHNFLWREQDIRRHAARKLTATLLRTCPRVPRLILCRAEETDSDLFCLDIRVSVPVCRIASALKAVSVTPAESLEKLATAEPLHLFWFPGQPPADSPEAALKQGLVSHGLLLEPFDRAGRGLKEVYGDGNPGTHAR